MSLRRRIVRLLQQSRIRLPRRPVEATELHPGDWIQLGSRAWRVLSRRFESDRVVFRLSGVKGREIAVLETSHKTSGGWTLRQRGNTIRLSPELLVVFPVGVP